MPTPGALAHFDVFGPDHAALRAFYAALPGWEVDDRGPGYALVTGPGDTRGALVEADDAGVSLGIAVADLPAAIAALEAAGGELDMPPTDNGWVVKARVRDPAGSVVTLIQT